MRYLARLSIALLLLACCVAQIGCTPRVVVRSQPRSGDPGIRYYRPKPYLKIEPAEIAIDKNQTKIVPGLVRISLVYMPDFSEEYSIDVRPGLGTADVGIKLEDGWNLTEISQDLDSQTDENISAVGDLLSGLGDVVPTAAGGRSSDVSFTVPARNVPIGFYESVIGRDGHGCKRLYGFRYVGFVPFSPCPLNMTGHEHAVCGDMCGALYGLSFIDGQMVFQPLDVMATSPVGGDSTSTHASATSGLNEQAEVASEVTIDRDLLAVDLRTHLLTELDRIGGVRVAGDASQLVIEIETPAAQADAARRSARRFLVDRFPSLGQQLAVRILPLD